MTRVVQKVYIKLPRFVWMAVTQLCQMLSSSPRCRS